MTAPAKIAFAHWIDQVEASGEPQKHEADDLDLIDAAIGYLQHARRALNQEKPETSTGRGYVGEAIAALSRVPQ